MKFDRHNPQNYKNLKILRHKGTERLDSFKGGRIIMTPCLQYFFASSPNYGLSLSKVFIDIMCGDSPDAQIMKKCFDYETWAIDISPTENDLHQHFILGDIVEKETWDKLPKADIISCNAAIDLIPQNERKIVYKFIYEKLNNNGEFVYTPVPLRGGYGIDWFDERNNIEKISFEFRGGFKNAQMFYKINK